MTFKDNFTIKDRIELLERWILVQSYIYYELNDNVASDFVYDDNVKQLVELVANYPDDFKASSYHRYFFDFEPGCTSGFNLLQRVERNDPHLYFRLYYDAYTAVQEKNRRRKND